MIPDYADLIDDARTRCLCDVGAPDYLAATAVSADGTAHLLLARADAIGDENTRYDPTCRTIAHEQLGPLPLGVVQRITIARRTHCCGRRTKAGAPCRTPVARAGDACSWHRNTDRSHQP
jgi:hypothetical protein